MGDEIKYAAFLQSHKNQLVLSSVPEHLWNTLFKKLTLETFDAGESFGIAIKDEDDPEKFVCSISDIKKSDSKHIYLIDHAWTYVPKEARHQLMTIPGLLDRMCVLMKIEQTESSAVELVLNEMWRYNQTYSISSGTEVEDRLPIWYIMDEFGSTIAHSNDPNFQVAPFAFASQGITYSIMFPIKDVSKGEEITRDYVSGFSDESMRKALLLPWFENNFKHITFIPSEPSELYFTTGHLNETLPDLNNLSHFNSGECKSNILKVFSDYEFINNYLTDKRFEIVKNDEEADILWYTSHFTDYKTFSEINSKKFINQFPYEFVITIKNLLSIICRRAAKSEQKYNTRTFEIFPTWLPETFNLSTELPIFLSYFQQRKDRGLDNHWICKPWNLARGLDTHITDNVNFIVRLPNSGLKIAQKYIHNPILFYREDVSGTGLVKFDIRYVLLLKSVKPLDVYVYKHFFLRFANKSFELNNFDDYETHFTVMNYSESTPLHRMLCADFIKQFETQYPSISWCDVEMKIFEMFKELFEAATKFEAPCGIGVSPQSRALYAADIMLSYSPDNIDIEPKLLEINWIPDCERACLYYNDFYNDIFSLLFLNERRDVFYML